MDHWMEQAKMILDQTPTLAMPLSRLLTAMRDDGATATGKREWVLRRLMEQPGVFRIIPDRLGPWILWPDSTEPATSAHRTETPGSDPWIMTSAPPPPRVGTEWKIVRRIQESLQAWGWEVDTGSQVAVARWIGASGEAEKAVGSFLTGEGRPA